MNASSIACLLVGIWSLSGCSGSSFSSQGQTQNLGSGGAGSSDSGSGTGAAGTTSSSGGASSSSGGATGTGAASADGAAGAASGGAPGSGGIASSDAGSGTSDAGSGIACWGTTRSFPTFEKGCTNTESCVLVRHQTDCCGGELIMAINHAAVDAFDRAEKICDAQYPACGCAAQGVMAEDGTLVSFGSESLIVATCDNGTCLSKYSGQTFTCGPKTCTALDYCSVLSTGGVNSNWSCVPLNGCTDCSCASTSGSCQCVQGPVGMTVTCKNN